MNKTTSIIIAIVIIAGGVWYVSSKKMSTQTPVVTQNNTPTVMTPAATSPEVVNAKSFTVEGGNFKFSLDKISVTKGDTVKITFKNTEGFHDFVLDEFQVRTKQIPAGQEETIQFVADKVGTFEYYCSVGSHRRMGMVGTLEVK